MSETSQIVTPLLKALRRLPGVVACRLPAGTGSKRIRGAGKGMPDVLCVVRGVPLFFEAKLPKGRFEDGQLEKHAELRRAGARVEVIYSVAGAIATVREILEDNAP